MAGWEAFEPVESGPSPPAGGSANWNDFEPIPIGASQAYAAPASKSARLDRGGRLSPTATPAPPPEQFQRGTGLTDEFVSGMPIVGPLMDKASAAIGAGIQPLFGAGADQTFVQRYAGNLANQEAARAGYETQHPIASTAAKVAGGTMALAPVGATSLGARLLGLTGGLPGMAARGALSGAALSAADAALRGEDVQSAAELGGLISGVAPGVGRGLGVAFRGARDFIAPAPRVAQNVANVGGVDVPLSGGQVTGNVGQSAAEQAAARGGLGPRAETVARGFFDQQAAAAEQARANIGRGLDPFGQTVAGSPQEAGTITSDAIQRAADLARGNYQTAYGRFAALPGEIEPGAFQRIGQSIRQRLSAGSNPVIIDDRTTPYAAVALNDLDKNVGALRFQNEAQPGPTLSIDQNGRITAAAPPAQSISLSQVDQARKRLVSIYGAAKGSGNAADARATQRVIGAFDDHVQDAIDAGLFSGSDQALPALKDARAAYAQYRSTFTPQGPGDEVGRVMQKILGRYDGQAATPTEVANYLYGSANVGAPGLATKLGLRVKSVLGADSPEWSAVRQGLWSRLTESAEGRTDWGPQRISERVYEFLNGSGKPLSQLMFSPQERTLMGQYAGLLKQLVPPGGAVNTSNTATVQRILGGVGHRLMTMLGITHGPVGMVAGHALDRGLQAAGNRAAASMIARSLYGGTAPVNYGARLAPASSLVAQASAPQMRQQRPAVALPPPRSQIQVPYLPASPEARADLVRNIVTRALAPPVAQPARQ